MPSYSGSYAYTNTLQTLTKDRVVADFIVETFFDSAALWQYVRDKGQYVEAPAGLAFSWAINTGSSPNTLAFAGDQNLPIVSMDTNMQRPALDPKFYADALVLKLTDTALNNGSPDAVANYADAQFDIVKLSIVNKLADDLIKNTQTVNALGLNGFLEAIDDTTGPSGGNYANLSRATYTTWSGKINHASTTAGNAEIGDIQTQYLAAQVDNDLPDTFAVNRKGFQVLWNFLQARDQYIQPDLARTWGGTNLLYQGNPMFMDSHIPSNTTQTGATGTGGNIFGFNSNYVKLQVVEGWNFRVTEWREAEQNATIYARIFWGGNLLVLKPSGNFNLWVAGF